MAIIWDDEKSTATIDPKNIKWDSGEEKPKTSDLLGRVGRGAYEATRFIQPVIKMSPLYQLSKLLETKTFGSPTDPEQIYGALGQSDTITEKLAEGAGYVVPSL